MNNQWTSWLAWLAASYWQTNSEHKRENSLEDAELKTQLKLNSIFYIEIFNFHPARKKCSSGFVTAMTSSLGCCESRVWWPRVSPWESISYRLNRTICQSESKCDYAINGCFCVKILEHNVFENSADHWGAAERAFCALEMQRGFLTVHLLSCWRPCCFVCCWQPLKILSQYCKSPERKTFSIHWVPSYLRGSGFSLKRGIEKQVENLHLLVISPNFIALVTSQPIHQNDVLITDWLI